MAGSVSPAAVAANRAVAAHLDAAATASKAALEGIEQGGKLADVATQVRVTTDSLTQAATGARALRKQGIDMLDGAAHRYVVHASRDAEDANAILGRDGGLSADALGVLRKRLFYLEVHSRLGHESAFRSLESPALRRLESSSRSAGAADSSSLGGHTYLGESGTWVDELGNQVTGGNTWAGPDGQRYDSLGNAAPRTGGTWDQPDYAGGHLI